MNLNQIIRPLAVNLHRSPARGEDTEAPRGWWSKPHPTLRLDACDDGLAWTEAERRAYCRRSLRATLVTFAVVMTLLALLFGLAAASGGL